MPKEKTKIVKSSKKKQDKTWEKPELYIIELQTTTYDPYGGGSDDYGGAYDS